MNALDSIKDRGVKKARFPESRWAISGSTLVLDGQVRSGSVDWSRSRYLKKGQGNEFYAFLSGSGVVPHYEVFREEKREGYVRQPDLGWRVPTPTTVEDDDG